MATAVDASGVEIRAPLVRRTVPAAVRRKRLLIAIADHSVLIVLAIVFIAPFVFMALTALMTNAQALTPNVWPHPFAFGNITEVFRKAPMMRYAANTLRIIFTLSATVRKHWNSCSAPAVTAIETLTTLHVSYCLTSSYRK